MGEWRILRTHVLRNALLPIVTMLGMDMGSPSAARSSSSAPSGCPGSAAADPVARRRDLPVILGIVVLVTTAILFFNLLVDLLYPARPTDRSSRRRGSQLRERRARKCARAGARRPPSTAARRPRRGSRSAARARRSATARRGARRCSAARGRARARRRAPRGSARSPCTACTTAPRSRRSRRRRAWSTSSAKVASVTSLTSCPCSAARRSSGTFQIASSTIARDIFEPPTSRSAKRIGISSTRKPARSAR